jgi:hypothetical protein
MAVTDGSARGNWPREDWRTFDMPSQIDNVTLRSIRADPARRSVRRILGTGVECDRRLRCALVDSVYDPLEERQPFWRDAQTATDHDTIVVRLRQLIGQYCDATIVGSDHADIAVPTALGHCRLGDVDARLDLFSIEPWWQRGIGKVDGFGLLPDKQYTCHDQITLKGDGVVGRVSSRFERNAPMVFMDCSAARNWLRGD